jgi:hypothetical protein
MSSVAAELRRESSRALQRLSPWQRVELALRLGDEDVALHQAAHGGSDWQVRIAFSRARAIGRRPSRSNDRHAP